MSVVCPFCGCDPYEYIDVGVGGGGVPVAVTCCDLGIEYFKPREDSEAVEISKEDFDGIAETFRAMRRLGLSPETS